MKPLYLSAPVRKHLPSAIRPGGLALTERMLELIDIREKCVVDAGCGTGTTLALLQSRGARWTVGIDPRPELLAEASQKKVRAVNATMEYLPLSDNCCDLILSECAWNLSEKRAALAEFHRVLRPGGTVVISDIFTRAHASVPWPVSCCFAAAESLEAITTMIREAGFSIETLEDHTQLLKQTAAEFVFQYGSLQGFWQQVTGDLQSARAACFAGLSTLPGLFLVIARKEGSAPIQDRLSLYNSLTRPTHMSQYDNDILQFAGQGFCCSQILLQLALEMQGTENPGLTRALQGLCQGGGDVDSTCGALTGAQCLLAYYLGKGSSSETAHNRLPLLLSELQIWFKKRTAFCKGTSCGAIAPTPDDHFATCPSLIGDTAEKVFELLVSEEIELDRLKEEL